MSFRVIHDEPAFRVFTPSTASSQAAQTGFKAAAPVGVLIGPKGDRGAPGALDDDLPNLVLLFEGALIS